MPSLTDVHQRLDRDRDAALRRLFELLRIPSVSADPAYAAPVREAASWLVSDLASIGFDVTRHETPGHPMVVGHHPGPAPDRPCVLYYGHYDVQPPDPVDQWATPPFEPQLIDVKGRKRIVGRGSSDDKGQLMTFVEAFRAWKAVHGTLPFRITVLLEGEEESGSRSLEPFLRAHRDELRADVGIVCDTSMWDERTPAITCMLRGLVYVEVTLHGPSHDLHSGAYGGAVVNPINALARVLAALHDGEGRVQIPGFYDEVRELSPQEAAAWKGLGFDEASFLSGAGLKTSMGERGRSVLERIWSRPTCDVNGIWGGYTGGGAKTVIPASASAKLSCRLVHAQDPARVFESLVRFFEERTPPGCRWQITQHSGAPAISVPTDSPWFQSARAGLEDVFGRPPVLIGSGGSIPVVGSLRTILGFDSLLVGFALDDDRIHSPNEKYELASFERGMKAHAAIMARIAERGAGQGSQPRSRSTRAPTPTAPR
jgi:acetylornithine deacetylase/succinyl-diaminopimelate desuccinylase-like protein